jgi:hypothetical protein
MLWRALKGKMLVHFMAIWAISLRFDIFYGRFVYFVVVWYIFPRFGILYQEKSGSPGWEKQERHRGLLNFLSIHLSMKHFLWYNMSKHPFNVL